MPETPCKLWTGPWNKVNGYGYTHHEGAKTSVHRLAFFLANGYWPKICRHTCDVKLCWNPDHLIDGTQADNIRDAMERGRMPMGSLHYKAKLDEHDVREIRKLASMGFSHQRVADAYDLRRRNVGHIVNREKWKHVE